MNAAISGSAQTARQLQVTSIQYDHKLLLTDALRVIGLNLKGGFVSFGVDISGEAEPEVDVNMPETNLADALQRITSQIPGYTSEIVSEHVVEIYAAKDRANPDDPLNLPIHEFTLKDVPATTILSSPTQYIPELNAYLSKDHNDDHKDHPELGCGSFVSRMTSEAPGVTLFLTGRTVRQILDAVAEADAVLPALMRSQHLRPYPSGWVHRRKNDPKLGVVDTWSAMSFAPHDWKLYVAK
jgi:hypothetical protein